MTHQTASVEEDQKFMRIAIDAAKRGIDSGQTPFGACIVRNGKVIVASHNQVWMDTDITAHAEIVAIRASCQAENSIALSGCTIYSTVEPCPMCFAAIHWARISRIVYGASIDDAAQHGFNELHISNEQLRTLANLSTHITPGVLTDQCTHCFSQWRAHPNHQPY